VTPIIAPRARSRLTVCLRSCNVAGTSLLRCLSKNYTRTPSACLYSKRMKSYRIAIFKLRQVRMLNGRELLVVSMQQQALGFNGFPCPVHAVEHSFQKLQVLHEPQHPTIPWHGLVWPGTADTTPPLQPTSKLPDLAATCSTVSPWMFGKASKSRRRRGCKCHHASTLLSLASHCTARIS